MQRKSRACGAAGATGNADYRNPVSILRL